MTKIAIIGAGSAVFAQQMITDALAIEGLNSGEFALVDIDQPRLEAAQELAELTVKRSGKAFTVTASTGREAALRGADFVINTIEVSGLNNVQHDFNIPMRYGVNVCIGDTIGPGGLMKFLRTAPAFLEIVRDIGRLAPDAVLMNYTNPMSALVLLATRAAPELRTIGLCHSIQNTLHEIAGYIGLPANELRYRCAGVNHLSWFTELTHGGQDVMPLLYACLQRTEIYEQDIIRFEMLRHFGGFPTESSGHFSEYVPYFRKRPELVEKFTRAAYKGETGYYAHHWPQWRAEHEAEVRRLTLRERAGEAAIDMNRSPEFASNIIEGITLGRPQVISGNVPNTGLITNLEQDGIAEVSCLVDGNGIQPLYYGALPEALAAIDRAHMAVHHLMAQAVLHADREAALHALMLDPLTAAVCSLDEIRAMFGELVQAEANDLPDFVRA